MTVRILHGDMREKIAELADCSIDSIVTDPPYGLNFMGKDWDHGVPGPEFWMALLRVAKPGAHLLAFGGSRTFHRLWCAIEDAGWEIRDTLMWLYGSGFPKSLDVAKALDRAFGVEREDKYEGSFQRRAGPTGNKRCAVCGKWLMSGSPCQCPRPQDAPVSALAAQWHGWGTALKPAFEPILMARKPLIGTVAENVAAYRVGALNIDACRINPGQPVPGGGSGRVGNFADKAQSEAALSEPRQEAHNRGRWPANVLHDGSDEVVGMFPEKAGAFAPVHRRRGDKFRNTFGAFAGNVDEHGKTFHDNGARGSAARLFWCSKASKRDRNDGLPPDSENFHPTVKPIELMCYLVRLVTPRGGVVLDPFMGSGSTGKAAVREGMSFVGIELDERYIEIARRRIHSAAPLFAEVG